MHEDRFKTFVIKDGLFTRVNDINFNNLKVTYPNKIKKIQDFEIKTQKMNYVLTTEYKLFLFDLQRGKEK